MDQTSHASFLYCPLPGAEGKGREALKPESPAPSLHPAPAPGVVQVLGTGVSSCCQEKELQGQDPWSPEACCTPRGRCLGGGMDAVTAAVSYPESGKHHASIRFKSDHT